MNSIEYMDKEQGTAFEYCSNKTSKIAIFGMIIISIFFIPFAVGMVWAFVYSFIDPAEFTDNVYELFFFQIIFVVMAIGTFTILYQLIFLPAIKKSYSKNIFISEEGVYSQVNDNFIPWEKVKEISIGLKGVRNSINSFIWIQSDNFKLNKWSVKNFLYSNDLICMECTNEKVDAILQYYDDEIENLKSFNPKAESKIMTVLMIYIIILLAFLLGVFIWIFFFL